MANYQQYRTESGESRWLAVACIKGFKRTSRAFAEPSDAKECAEGFECEFRAMRDRGGSPVDVGTITMRQLIERFLADPTVSQLKWHPQLEAILAAWTNEFGGTRVRSAPNRGVPTHAACAQGRALHEIKR